MQRQQQCSHSPCLISLVSPCSDYIHPLAQQGGDTRRPDHVRTVATLPKRSAERPEWMVWSLLTVPATSFQIHPGKDACECCCRYGFTMSHLNKQRNRRPQVTLILVMSRHILRRCFRNFEFRQFLPCTRQQRTALSTSCGQGPIVTVSGCRDAGN